MKILVLSLIFTLQTWSGKARVHKTYQAAYNSTKTLDLAVQPGSGGEVTVPGNLDLSINSGSFVSASGTNPVSTGNSNGQTGNLDISINSGFNNQLTIVNSNTPVRRLECGSVVQMYPGNSVQVSSTNFGVGNYYNNEACTWRFEANQCTLSAHCPCVDIPRSWECLGDYLKIKTDYILQNQRFCGGNKPGQPVYSDSDFLNVRFRSDSRETASGFMCSIRCEGPGTTIPVITPVCPASSTSQG